MHFVGLFPVMYHNKEMTKPILRYDDGDDERWQIEKAGFNLDEIVHLRCYDHSVPAPPPSKTLSGRSYPVVTRSL